MSPLLHRPRIIVLPGTGELVVAARVVVDIDAPGDADVIAEVLQRLGFDVAVAVGDVGLAALPRMWGGGVAVEAMPPLGVVAGGREARGVERVTVVAECALVAAAVAHVGAASVLRPTAGGAHRIGREH